MGFVINERIIERKNGEIAGRIEHGSICDEKGGELLLIKGNEIRNKLGTTLVKVEKGGIVSTSGHEMARVLAARMHFENSNSLSDAEIAGAWMCFVKGVK